MKAIYLIDNFDKKNPVFFVTELKEKVDNYVDLKTDSTGTTGKVTGFNERLATALTSIKTKVNFDNVNIQKQKIEIGSDSVMKKLAKQGQKFTVLAIYVNESGARQGLLLTDEKGTISTITTDNLVKAMEAKTANVTNMYIRDGALVMYDDVTNIPNIVIGKKVMKEEADVVESNGDLVDFWTIGNENYTLEKDLSMIKNQPDKIKGKFKKKRVFEILKLCRPNEIDIENQDYKKVASDFVAKLMPYREILDKYSEVSFDKVQAKLKQFIKESKDKNFLDDFHREKERGASYFDVSF